MNRTLRLFYELKELYDDKRVQICEEIETCERCPFHLFEVCPIDITKSKKKEQNDNQQG